MPEITFAVGVAACPECGGSTIKFRGSGKNLQYKVCSRVDAPGHKAWDELAELAAKRTVHAPAPGRFA